MAYHLQLASSLAIEQYRKINKNPEGRIGIILNLTPSYPATEKIEDLKAAEMADLWQNRLFLDASIKGEFPEELVSFYKKKMSCGSRKQKI